MKPIYALVITIFCTLFCADCQVKKPIGGGFSVTCQCYKDSVSHYYYPLGNAQYPYDSLNVINPYYSDSCNKIKTTNNFDSAKVRVIVL